MVLRASFMAAAISGVTSLLMRVTVLSAAVRVLSSVRRVLRRSAEISSKGILLILAAISCTCDWISSRLF